MFDVVGTPRRWLWPVLWVLGLQGIVFPAWAQNVPFSVVNRPTSTPAGRVGVGAVRTFHFPAGRFSSGDRRMVDAITAEPGGLVDRLGPERRYSAPLRATVRDGALHLDSCGLGVRIGRRGLRIPAAIAPRVHLVERFDDVRDRQHVSLTLTMPIVGRLYEYAGDFAYAITTATDTADVAETDTHTHTDTDTASTDTASRGASA